MLVRIKLVLRWTLVVLCACAPLVAPPTAEAKRRTGVNDAILEEDHSKSYTLPYALVVLGVALGVLIVARPGTRADAPRHKAIGNEDE